MRTIFKELELLSSFNKLDEETKTTIEENKYFIFEKYKKEFIQHINLSVKISNHSKSIMDRFYEIEYTKTMKKESFSKKEIFEKIADEKDVTYKAIEKTYYKYKNKYFNKFQNL